MLEKTFETNLNPQEQIIGKDEARAIFKEARLFLKDGLEIEEGEMEDFKQKLKQAEAWLNAIKNDSEKLEAEIEKDNGRNIDHRERELFKAYRKMQDWDCANAVIESMLETPQNKEYESRQGRIDILSKEMSRD